MEGTEQTTRQRIAAFLREEPAEAGRIATEFGITAAAALSHVEHISKSLDGTGEELLAAPPECRECGFSGFDDLVNRPSRCPECKAEAVSEPAFTVR
ncbi:transcriptional regulator [Natronomonas sp. LN261]|jgi:predicted Zn-ribbon and HTH transcriptional regulator|uniref:transcriptional regulator n=1 Tax=Natronomonas sp. LN261 TaxID=2750669 RepID=UPI0015EF4393|nr:transcriptional regulator [Natronomonas sp. LN261]